MSEASGEGKESDRLSTGVAGLDEVMQGGLIPRRTYLVRGMPGCGKTTLAFHFLAEGVARGEKGLLISLGEAEDQIRANAQSFGFDLSAVAVLDLSPTSKFFAEGQTYDVFPPGDVEREPLAKQIVDEVTKVKPTRVVVDGLTHLRYLSRDVFQYRRQVLSFLQFLRERGATVLFTAVVGAETPDEDLQFMTDGVICLEFPQGGRRTLTVTKFRGSSYRLGSHSVRITPKGLQVAPRLLPDEYRRAFAAETMPTGVAELDAVLHGGIERGVVTILSGPTGVGKTTLAMQVVKEAAARGEHSVVYCFEELVAMVVARCEATKVPVKAMMDEGTLSLVHVEPLHYTADEFAQLVRRQVEDQKARVVVLDSISGYRLCLRGEDLTADLHALCKYLKNMGVTVILAYEVSAVGGDFRVTEEHLSYLADNVVFLRYMEYLTEADVEVRKLVGVLKKRLTDFENTVREFAITPDGVRVRKLKGNLSTVLGDTPVCDGREKPGAR